jgi:metal-responsive CopG/Arc/MetJ family transcriptional regulator
VKTISITIDERLLRAIDKAAAASRRTRSDLFRTALQHWLASLRRRELVEADREGYLKQPVSPDEFDGIIAAQAFTDDTDDR